MPANCFTSSKVAALNSLKGQVMKLDLFTGLRDDPFIRRPREGRNVAAVVIELPLEAVRKLASG